MKEAIFFCIVGLPLFGKGGSGTPVFTILVRALNSPFYVLNGHRSKFLNYDVFMSLKTNFIIANIANIADPDEMQHYEAFHLGLHCLPEYMYLFPVSRNEKVKKLFTGL